MRHGLRHRYLAAAAAGLWLTLLPPGAAAAPQGPSSPADARPVDLNSATAAQLAALPGIGAEQARRIVASRPYLTKTDLVTRHVLPDGLYLQIKDRVVAIQKTGRPGPAAAHKATAP